MLVAAAEMCLASGLGLDVNLSGIGGDPLAEPVGWYLAELAGDIAGPDTATEVIVIGRVSSRPELSVEAPAAPYRTRISIDELLKAWRGTLDW